MKILIAVALLCTTLAYADDHDEKKAERFSKRKAKVLENIGKREAALSEFKSCVSAANDKDAMKACRKAHKAKRKILKAEMKEKKAKRKAKREARKNKN